ncbi:hypothetical protein BBJ28_00005218 [Nothophytophthora sp. Chile5]|nr:hypothetical protein BBJ28_00005218 [Nothophytophthora sp. Chile5]
MEDALEGFDVDAYAAKYSGRNRTERLLFIAKSCPSLYVDARRALLRELKGGRNMALYLEVLDGEPADMILVESVKRSASQQHERLEQELNSYKSTMIKESIRVRYAPRDLAWWLLQMGHNDLGDFYYQLGDLPAALKSFAQARDYCTTDKHIIEMCLNVSKVRRLQCLCSKARVDTSEYSRVWLILCCCRQVLHAEDIALYGGICALASFKREELKEKVINNSSFKAFLELLPWLRELISDFYSSNYASCLQTLEKKKPELRLDIYLCEHVDQLCKEIRSRGIIQYFYPYLSVDLHQMARTFNTPTPSLEKEICELIDADRLHARMDSYQKVRSQRGSQLGLDVRIG